MLGPMNGYDLEIYHINTYVYICVWTIVCCMSNILIKRRMNLTQKSTRAFYLLHSAMNGVICWLTFDDMIFTLKYPLESALCESEDVEVRHGCRPSSAIFVMLGIHISHCITDYMTLTLTDYIHHGLSCGMSGYFMLVYRLGPVKNYALFYSCGAPGMLSYLALFMVKNGYLNRLTEKRLSTLINQYVRAPMLFLLGYIVILCHTYGKWEKLADGVTNEMPFFVLMMMVISVSCNGVFFAHIIAISYGKALAHAKDDLLKKPYEGIPYNKSFTE